MSLANECLPIINSLFTAMEVKIILYCDAVFQSFSSSVVQSFSSSVFQSFSSSDLQKNNTLVQCTYYRRDTLHRLSTIQIIFQLPHVITASQREQEHIVWPVLWFIKCYSCWFCIMLKATGQVVHRTILTNFNKIPLHRFIKITQLHAKIFLLTMKLN